MMGWIHGVIFAFTDRISMYEIKMAFYGEWKNKLNTFFVWEWSFQALHSSAFHKISHEIA